MNTTIWKSNAPITEYSVHGAGALIVPAPFFSARHLQTGFLCGILNKTAEGGSCIKHFVISKPLIAVFAAAEGLLYLVFLVWDITGRSGDTLWLKYAGILLCFAFALFCALRGGSRLVAPALLFTAGADWFLLVRGDHLILGVVLFLCVQFLYALRLHRAGGSRKFLWLRPALAVVFTLAPFLIPGMAAPLNLLAMFYFSQLLSNTLLAWTLPAMRIFALGLTLFVGCDICVGLFNILPAAAPLFCAVSVGMWFFYLPSQVLIALSARLKEGNL